MSASGTRATARGTIACQREAEIAALPGAAGDVRVVRGLALAQRAGDRLQRLRLTVLNRGRDPRPDLGLRFAVCRVARFGERRIELFLGEPRR